MAEEERERREVYAAPDDRAAKASGVHDGLPMVLAVPLEAGSAMTRAAATMISAAFSIALHGSIAAAVFLWFEPRPGAVAFSSEAISVELVASDVVNAMQPEARQDVAALSSPPPQAETKSAQPLPDQPKSEKTEDVQAAPREASEEVAVARVDDTPPPMPESVPAVEDPPATAESPPETVTSTTPVIERSDPVARPKDDKRVEDTRRSKPKRELVSRNKTTSRSRSESKPSGGHVSASKGSAINYAARVRAHVMARQPSGTGAHGAVSVTFGVSGSGGLSFVRIARSSGDAGLDRSVLAAVRGAAPFPVPPPGATRVQTRFDMQFSFR